MPSLTMQNRGRSFMPLLISVGILSLPVLGEVEGGDQGRQPTALQIVDIVTPQVPRSPVCSETHWDSHTPCWVSGVVEGIAMEASRVSITLSGQKFKYLLGNKSRWEKGSPLSLLVASKLNRVPVQLRFENWGGNFYIAEVSL
jgi:hypothetical protein